MIGPTPKVSTPSLRKTISSALVCPDQCQIFRLSPYLPFKLKQPCKKIIKVNFRIFSISTRLSYWLTKPKRSRLSYYDSDKEMIDDRDGTLNGKEKDIGYIFLCKLNAKCEELDALQIRCHNFNVRGRRNQICGRLNERKTRIRTRKSAGRILKSFV